MSSFPQNVCKSKLRDKSERLWRVIEQLGSSGLGYLILNNLAVITVVTSLLFWIPISLLVHRIDQRRKMKRQRAYEFYMSGVRSVFCCFVLFRLFGVLYFLLC